MLESELESSLKKSLQIKEDKMAALEARLQESSTLNQQLRQELKTVSHQDCWGKKSFKNTSYFVSHSSVDPLPHTGEAELRGSAAEAGGGEHSVMLHSSIRDWQSNE